MGIEEEVITGKGFRFPFRFTDRTGGIGRRGAEEVQVRGGVEKVVDGILQILGVRKKEMPGDRSFGSMIFDLSFEPNNTNLRTILEHKAKSAILEQENRVASVKANSYMAGNRNALVLRISFTLVSTREQGNLIVPFAFSDDGLELDANNARLV